MGELIRNAVNVGLLDPAGLGRVDRLARHERCRAYDARLAEDCAPHSQRVAADEETTLQVLEVAAIERTYPGPG